MRRVARSIVLLIVSLLGAIAVATSYTVTAAVTLTATAIVVPGTGDPDANSVPNYLENFRDYYMGGTFCDPGTNCDGEDLFGVDYPASFWPLVIFPSWCQPERCEKWNVSVQDGVAGLNAALIETWRANPDEQIVIAGYSQGGAVVSNQLRNLAKLSDEEKALLEVVLIGNIANPDGGLWPRLSPLNFLAELLLDATLGPPMITDTGIPIDTIGFYYDPVVLSPLYWGNAFAVLNALVAFDTVHGQYVAGPNRPEAGALPYGYQPDEVTALLADARERCGEDDSNCRLDRHGNRYIMIPAKSLPLADAVLSLGASAGLTPIVKPLVDLFTPVVKVLVDLGYDWSGDPGVARPLSLLPFNPFNNWGQVAVDLVEAVGEGVEAFLGNFDVTTPAQNNPAQNQPPAEILAQGPPEPPARARSPKPAVDVRTVSTPTPVEKSEPALVETLSVPDMPPPTPKLQPVADDLVKEEKLDVKGDDEKGDDEKGDEETLIDDVVTEFPTNGTELSDRTDPPATELDVTPDATETGLIGGGDNEIAANAAKTATGKKDQGKKDQGKDANRTSKRDRPSKRAA